MKTFAGLFLGALLLGGSAYANTYVVGLCGTFSDPLPNLPLSGSWGCPSAAALGLPTYNTEFIVYDSDYSNGVVTPVTATTTWDFVGTVFSFATDTLTTTGLSNSTSTASADGLSFNNSNNLPPLVFPGFYDTATTLGTPTVDWTAQVTAGGALGFTGYAEVVYGYVTPEPAALSLLVVGFVGALLYLRKRRLSA